MSVGGLVLVVEAQQHPNPHSYKIVKLTLTCPHQELEDEFPFGIPGMPFFPGGELANCLSLGRVISMIPNT